MKIELPIKEQKNRRQIEEHINMFAMKTSLISGLTKNEFLKYRDGVQNAICKINDLVSVLYEKYCNEYDIVESLLQVESTVGTTLYFCVYVPKKDTREVTKVHVQGIKIYRDKNNYLCKDIQLKILDGGEEREEELEVSYTDYIQYAFLDKESAEMYSKESQKE